MLPKSVSHEIAEEMALMLDVLETWIDLGQQVACGSPCHKKIAELLDKAGYVRED
jgi:hypothetical protein